MVLSFRFPHYSPLGETIASLLNIPVRSAGGLQYVEIALMFLLIWSLYLLFKSLEKYGGRTVLFALIVFIVVPQFIIGSYQNIFARGIYAITYDMDTSTCEFDMVDQDTLSGICELTLENHSKKATTFSVAFHDEYEDEFKMVTLMNENGPYQIEMAGKEHKQVIIETQIDVSEMEYHIENGTASILSITIDAGDKERRLW